MRFGIPLYAWPWGCRLRFPDMNIEGFHDCCLLYTSDAADERSSVDLGGRRIIKKKTHAKIDVGDRHELTSRPSTIQRTNIE